MDGGHITDLPNISRRDRATHIEAMYAGNDRTGRISAPDGIYQGAQPDIIFIVLDRYFLYPAQNIGLVARLPSNNGLAILADKQLHTVLITKLCKAGKALDHHRVNTGNPLRRSIQRLIVDTHFPTYT